MNRRGFLKFLGGAAIASLSARDAIARALVAPGARLSLPEVESEELLRVAIERLFPAGVVRGAVTAWAEFDEKNRMLSPYELYAGRTARVVFRSFAFGYYVEDDEARMHQALYATMYRTWEQIAERAENSGAILVWRKEPIETREKEDFEEGGQSRVKLRLRAGLLQQGWRRAMDVAPWVGGAHEEGSNMRMLLS